MENGKTFLTVSKHYCAHCKKHFTNPAGEKHAPLRRSISWGLLLRVLQIADARTLEEACAEIKKQTGYELRPTTLHDWVTDQSQLLERFRKIKVSYGESSEEKETR